jgi:hypothetical protein
MLAVRDALHFVRWRVVALRYAGRLAMRLSGPQVPARTIGRGTTDLDRQIRELGYAKGPGVPPDLLAQALAIYAPRAEQVVPAKAGHPFVNLFRPDDASPENPVFRFALSEEVLDRAHDYFDGDPRFDSIQVLYSWPTDSLSESQMWHKDYGDSKSFHCVAYLNDVTSPEDGPFVFVDRRDSQRIARSPFIRRIPDARFARELKNGEQRVFYGKAGESVLIDPSACYHYGSRCRNPRLAIFVTFSSNRPFVPPQPMIRGRASANVAAARQVRPDLSEAYLSRIFAA